MFFIFFNGNQIDFIWVYKTQTYVYSKIRHNMIKCCNIYCIRCDILGFKMINLRMFCNPLLSTENSYGSSRLPGAINALGSTIYNTRLQLLTCVIIYRRLGNRCERDDLKHLLHPKLQRRNSFFVFELLSPYLL